MNTTPATTPDSGRKAESVMQAVIMLAVAGMAGAASFTHVHDWTMHNSPADTGDWFGWANAMVSELIPLASGLEARRRIRTYGQPGVYPIVLIVAAVALSLTGQFAEATHSVSGWLISAVPALGFLALVKLVLSSPHAAATTRTLADQPIPAAVGPEISERAPIATGAGYLPPTGPPGGLALARFAANNYLQTMGRPITPADLAARISVSPTMAATILDTLTREEAPARLNGHRVESPAGGPR